MASTERENKRPYFVFFLTPHSYRLRDYFSNFIFIREVDNL